MVVSLGYALSRKSSNVQQFKLDVEPAHSLTGVEWMHFFNRLLVYDLIVGAL